MKHLAIPLLALMLAACGTTGKTITTAPVDIPAVVAPKPSPLNMREVRWQVLTIDDLRRIIAEHDANPDPNFAIYALDNGNFQALNLNIIDIRRFVLEQQQVIQFYKKIEEDSHPEPAPVPEKKCFLGICL